MPTLDAIKNKAIEAALMKSTDMLIDDFDKNMPRVLTTVSRFAGMGDTVNDHQLQLFNKVATMLEDKDNNWRQLVDKVRGCDRDMVRLFVRNFFMNSVVAGGNRQRQINAEYDCNCPWAILMDPTTACNLHCTGCWASHYEDAKHKSLTYEELDSIICQGKELGTYVYLYTGGEPMVRKADLIRLCEKHQDCIFSAFTNGTLVDDKFADELVRVKNFIPAFSIEGFREATDSRRGEGTFDKVVAAMDRLRERNLPFGASICYTSQNYDSITSDEFIDFLEEKGVLFAWIFTYMPVGQGAPVELLATDEQRAGMYHKVRDDWRNNRPIFFADFWNDGEYTGGCIAGGRRYMHINAGGDIEPCAFIHYSDCNIREKTLLECYQSPLFKSYRAHQPFNKNMLRPCPLLDNPGMLATMVDETGAHSTDYTHPEDVHELCGKTVKVAEKWAETSQPIWENSPKGKWVANLENEGKDPVGWVD
ncbi:MAG: radical SAM protein [Atopobiaceae bacterium]|jgi:MoaA/NifB/PqqE/SkfB family radical SAM enzyme|nr:radical SAM protein [Atopobiaceae bacterium]